MEYPKLIRYGGFVVNQHLISRYGIEIAFVIALLVERQKVCIKNNILSSDKYFGITDVEIALYSGIRFNRIEKIKKYGKKEGLFSIKENRITKETYYRLNEEKLVEIILKK